MTQTSTTRAPGGKNASARAANIGLWILQVVATVLFADAGVEKVLAHPQWAHLFTGLGLGTTGMYVIGALELAGAVALLIPRLAGLAALCFVGLMLGAQIMTVATFGLSRMVALPAFTVILVAVIAWGRRGSLAELARLVRR